MRAMLVAILTLSMTVPALALAIEGSDVMYIGGSVAGVKEGTIGRLDVTANQVLVYEHGESRVEIPYASIQRFQYSQRLARRLGVAATIAVVLVKYRQRRHVIELYFQDGTGVNQVAMFSCPRNARLPSSPC